MAQKRFVMVSVPSDVDERLQAFQQRIAAKRGVEITKVSKGGETLRVLLAVVEAAEQLDAPSPDTTTAK